MDKEKTISTAAEPGGKKRGGRKPMTAEEKAAAAKARAEEKAKADSLKPAFIVQFQGSEVDLDTLVEAAKADLRQAGGAHGLLCGEREVQRKHILLTTYRSKYKGELPAFAAAPLVVFTVYVGLSAPAQAFKDPVYARGGISRSGQSGCRLRV